jgi:hypothetical protein
MSPSSPRRQLYEIYRDATRLHLRWHAIFLVFYRQKACTGFVALLEEQAEYSIWLFWLSAA